MLFIKQAKCKFVLVYLLCYVLYASINRKVRSEEAQN